MIRWMEVMAITEMRKSASIACRRCGRTYLLGRVILPACPHCGASPRPLRIKFRNNGVAALLAVLALIALSISIFMPFLSMTKFGEVRTFSMVSGILELFDRDMILIGVVLFVFSILFPYVKLLGLLAATSSLLPLSDCTRHLLHKTAVFTGKYSLLDILVVAIIIVTVKFKDVVQATAMPGTTVFCAAILLSILSGLAVNLDHLKEKGS